MKRQALQLENPIGRLQMTSLSMTQTDECDPSNPDHANFSPDHEAGWPFVSHGAFYRTNQAPNGDGRTEACFSKKVYLHMWVGSGWWVLGPLAMRNGVSDLFPPGFQPPIPRLTLTLHVALWLQCMSSSFGFETLWK